MFTESGAAWTQAAKLTASDGAAQNQFGLSASISGNTVVVGTAAAESGSAAPGLGSVYLFTEPASGWTNMTQTAKLTASDSTMHDDFGTAVSIDGSTVVVGALNAMAGTQAGLGAAYVFAEPASGWTNMNQTAKLTASDGAAGDDFGQSLAISGDTVVVGALLATVGGNSDQGAAYVFGPPATGSAALPITAVSTTTKAGSYGAATVIPITVTFNESVTVTGTPELVLNSGTTTAATATYASGSGSSALIFNYTVAQSQYSEDLRLCLNLRPGLNGGTIDAGSTPVNLTLPAVGLDGAGNPEHRHRVHLRRLRERRFQCTALTLANVSARIGRWRRPRCMPARMRRNREPSAGMKTAP